MIDRPADVASLGNDIIKGIIKLDPEQTDEIQELEKSLVEIKSAMIQQFKKVLEKWVVEVRPECKVPLPVIREHHNVRQQRIDQYVADINETI